MSGVPDHALGALAERAGIALRWHDFRGQSHEVAPDTLRYLLGALDLSCNTDGELAESLSRLEASAHAATLPPLVTAVAGQPTVLEVALAQEGGAFEVELENGGGRVAGRLEAHQGRACLPPVDMPGYHRLQLGDQQCTLAVAPSACVSAADLCGSTTRRPWAVASQLYGLNLPGDGGIGTYDSLGHLAARLGAAGAAAVAVSPVHALFSAEPAHCSPYSPSSRLLLNALHVDPREAFAKTAGQAREALGLGDEIARHEAAGLIDWPQAGRARLAVLRWLFENALPQRPDLAREFGAHRQQAGTALEDHARFEALHAHFLREGTWSWRQWPQEYRDPRGEAVAAFAQAHAPEVDYHAFLQWLATRGLANAQRGARDAGMPIGLVADLAIGSDPNGSHVWSRQRETLAGVSIGAPPDPLAMQGQAWGLATLSPTAMRATGYGAFIELLRASMAHAGGVRLDHVLGLMRLWLVPDGASPLDGAYLAYPWQDLLRLIALESWRHRCMVIGEDLGTVPEGFRDTLAAHGVLGMSVLWFERDAHGFVPLSRWRRDSIAMTTTHDLPTAAGWWLGRDIDVRREIGLEESHEETERQHRERDHERNALWRALHVGERDAHNAPVPPRPENGSTDEFLEAAIVHVARSPAALAVVPLEDILGLTDAPNVPGTSDEHPNWRRRLPADLDTVLDSRPAQARLHALDQARSTQSTTP